MKHISAEMHDDPGLFVLDLLLRLRGVDSNLDRIRQRSGYRSIGVPEMLAYARELNFSASCVLTDWDGLSASALPGILPIRSGSFLLLGKVHGHEAVVMTTGAERPSIISRHELESNWDGRLIVITRRRAITTWLLRRSRSILDFFRHSKARSLTVVSRLASVFSSLADRASARSMQRPAVPTGPGQKANSGNAVIVFADHARKLGRVVAGLTPSRGAHPNEALAFLPAALEIVETPPSPVGRTIVISITAGFVVALIWACLGTIDVVAIAPGKVIPSDRTKTVQPFETAVVRAIYVQDGQTVRAGERLVDLDATISVAELNHIKSDHLSAQLDVARMKALLSSKADPASAFNPPPAATPAQVEMHRRFLVSQTAEQAAKLAAIDRQITQKEAERATSKASIDKLKATIGPLQQRVEIREQLYQKELGSKLQYLAEYQELVGQRQEILVQQSRFGEADAAIAVLVETRNKTIAEYERTLFEELAKAEQKAAGLSQDVIKAERHTGLQNLTAPIDGVVQQLGVHTIGGVVTPAQPILMIVPTDSNLEVEAMISNQDIGFVEPGQDAAIKIDTFNFTRYGLLHGKVVSISQDAIPRNKPPENGNAKSLGAGTTSSEPSGQELVYAARVSLDRSYMIIEGKRVSLSPGMAATVEIKSGSRSVISYLLSPIMRYKQESMRER
ncbi:hemolysin D [Bradyrhizobium japonicum]|uniref:HlyD family type I secretion periplasmic adaptor subunit n=1 Tax=Bradyrhizobium japonicum TaxID=375 RepID=UPI002168CBA5|nr:HlyD family type I secretion periplasmic adaptor subunit [Bradyrhizobium japonicum]MCS3501762.1 hemolysin D [Bradyrhizobium japonicum]MCS3965524.1 hemolysin D [Bradyrhizobium japonicum]MCS3997831.1 hemolysin D [Bradyrhizobium japonicum]